MKRLRWSVLLLALLAGLESAPADSILMPPASLKRTNKHLLGVVVDYTNNHGADRRIWSPALGERRDLYVYLPPGFDPAHHYPVMLWFHGIAVDEQSFLKDVLRLFDQAMCELTTMWPADVASRAAAISPAVRPPQLRPSR